MTKEEKNRYLAKLDGWRFFRLETRPTITYTWVSVFGDDWRICPDYLFSYDPIINLIQKQSPAILRNIGLEIAIQDDIVKCFRFSPEELADILIKVIKNEKP